MIVTNENKMTKLKKLRDKYAKKQEEYRLKWIDVKDQIIEACDHPNEDIYVWSTIFGFDGGFASYIQCTKCGLREMHSCGGDKLRGKKGTELHMIRCPDYLDNPPLPAIVRDTFSRIYQDY